MHYHTPSIHCLREELVCRIETTKKKRMQKREEKETLRKCRQENGSLSYQQWTKKWRAKKEERKRQLLFKCADRMLGSILLPNQHTIHKFTQLLALWKQSIVRLPGKPPTITVLLTTEWTPTLPNTTDHQAQPERLQDSMSCNNSLGLNYYPMQQTISARYGILLVDSPFYKTAAIQLKSIWWGTT